MKKNTRKHNYIKKMVLVAVFTALAYVVALVIRFPVPPFLTLDLKDAVIAIGGMACGPISAVLITAYVALLEFISVGDTGVYGLIMDIISSVGFALTASLVYKYRKTFSGAIVALCSAVAVMTAMMLVANLVITPYYMGVSVEAVKGLIPTLLLPFNFLKALLNAGVVALLYKPLTGALSGVLGKEKVRKKEIHLKTVLLIVVSVLLITVSLLILFLAMGAGVDFGFLEF